MQLRRQEPDYFCSPKSSPISDVRQFRFPAVLVLKDARGTNSKPLFSWGCDSCLISVVNPCPMNPFQVRVFVLEIQVLVCWSKGCSVLVDITYFQQLAVSWKMLKQFSIDQMPTIGLFAFNWRSSFLLVFLESVSNHRSVEWTIIGDMLVFFELIDHGWNITRLTPSTDQGPVFLWSD